MKGDPRVPRADPAQVSPITKIIYDSVLREKLSNLAQPIELCDESGRVLARVLPAIDPARDTEIEPQISEDELKRRSVHQGRTYTTAEVLTYLDRL
jgi:hypothetical protein